MSKLEFSRNCVKILERKLSDARDAIIFSEESPILSPDKKHVTLTTECYNNILKAINP